MEEISQNSLGGIEFDIWYWFKVHISEVLFFENYILVCSAAIISQEFLAAVL